MPILRARRYPVTRARLAAFLGAGWLLGMIIGYCVMGTTHAILERRAIERFGSRAGGTQQRSMREQAGEAAQLSLREDVGAVVQKEVQQQQQRSGGASKQAGDAAVAQAGGTRQAGTGAAVRTYGQGNAAAQEQAGRKGDAMPQAVGQWGAVQHEQQQQQAAGAAQQATGAAQQAAGATQQRGDTIHTLCPSNGSPYQNYQMRIAYATYQLILGMPGGERHVAFTRVLHRTVPDELMDEVPTFRANPLQPKCDKHCEYPVSDRANAVRQFLEAAWSDASLIKAPWLYVIESDYVFVKPLALPMTTAEPVDGWAYNFGYIQPMAHKAAMRKLVPKGKGRVRDIPSTGPAPMLLRREDWERLTPGWERLTAVIEADPTLRKELGWVREMYAFSSAVLLSGLRLGLAKAPGSPFITQLPVDATLGNAHAFHYTQCTIYVSAEVEEGTKLADVEPVWKYDKRFFTRPEDFLDMKPIPPPPEFRRGAFKFIEGQPVRKETAAAIEHMIAQMNRGIATLKPLKPAASR